MGTKPLKCPRCRRRMIRKPQEETRSGRPGEVKYRCLHCDSYFFFNDWVEYHEACAYELQKTLNWKKRLENGKCSPLTFNPSFRRVRKQ